MKWYWRNKVVKPASETRVVLYFSNLTTLMGLGTHTQDATGIDQYFAQNIQTGQIRAVVFIDHYQHRQMLRREGAIVISGKQTTIPAP